MLKSSGCEGGTCSVAKVRLNRSQEVADQIRCRDYDVFDHELFVVEGNAVLDHCANSKVVTPCIRV